MSTSTTSALALASEYSEKGVNHMATPNTSLSLPSPHQSLNSLDGPVAILWDIENCPVPSDVRADDVAGNIRMALRVHPVINGAVTLFSAYGDFNAFPKRLREGCQRTGVKLVDVPNGRKDAADKAILVDMFLFALDNSPPSSIMLISGDVDFAPALHILGQRGYTIILIIPSRVTVSSALCNAGRFVWDWSSVARGEGFLPPAKALIPTRVENNGYFIGSHLQDNVEAQNEEESIVYCGISQSCYNSKDFSVVSRSLSEFSSNSTLMLQNATNSRSYSLPSGLNEASGDQNELMWVQPGDVNGLKGQIVKLLEMTGGILALTRLPAEYNKTYGRPLYVSEYGASKLVNLLKKMADAISIEGKEHRKFVCLRNSKSGPNFPPVILARRDKKGKGAQEDGIELMAGGGSSDELSDDDRNGGEKSNLQTTDGSRIIDQNLDDFKYELQEILVSYSCRIFIGCFEAIYQQRHKRQLDYSSFGVNNLDELLEKVGDVVVLQEEPVSKKKFIVAIGA